MIWAALGSLIPYLQGIVMGLASFNRMRREQEEVADIAQKKTAQKKIEKKKTAQKKTAKKKTAKKPLIKESL